MKNRKNKNIGYSPVRVEKIEEAKKILEIINAEEMQKTNYKVPTLRQRIYNIFIDGREKIEDRSSIKLPNINNKNKKKIELTIGNKVYLVKSHQDLVCAIIIIIRGLLSKRYSGLKFHIYVLVTGSELYFYTIIEM